MLWILCSLLFWGLVVRELRGPWRTDRPEPIFVPWLLLLLALAVGCLWPPVGTWRFERFLEVRASQLAEGRPATVHCNTLFDSMLDRYQLAAGHANPETGEIVIQKPWCRELRDYLDHPEHADDRELNSLNLLTHEAMHVRGELNEAVTECQAVQRNYRTARLLGVPEPVARANARDIYTRIYPLRAVGGGLGQAYHSAECAPGRALDERLPDSSWSP